jgi:hypothetical protein
MKLFNYISGFLFVGALVVTSCSQEEPADSEELMQGLQLSVSDGGFLNAETRAVDNAYKTTFTEGDAVGVFAVKSGVIVDNINNRKFVMTDGLWELDGDVIEYKGTEFKKMKFYAYYPYSETAVIDAANATDPFETIVKNWSIGADQSGDNYTKYDLMTSVGEAEGLRLQGKVEFTMMHRMGLALIVMPTLVYDFTNEGIADYSLKVSVGDFSINSQAATPYYDAATGVYRALVKPDAQFKIEGTYAGVTEMIYTAQGTLGSGAARQYTIKDSSKITHTLAAGDYFCADGSIVAKNPAAAPANAIGIVIYAGNPQPSVTHAGTYTTTNDILSNDYPNSNHGLVIALNNGVAEGQERYRFANAKKLYYDWFKTDDEWKDRLVGTETKTSIPGFMGYNNTVLMEHAFLLGEAYQNSILYGYTALEAYRAQVAVPSSATRWFVPSTEEWTSVVSGLAAVNAALTVAGGQALESNDGAVQNGIFYWTNTERNSDWLWGHKLTGGSEIAQRTSSAYLGYFRFMLAF